MLRSGFVLAILLPVLLQFLLAPNPDQNVATAVLVQLTGSVAVALVGGFWPAILAALWSSLLVNYFSTPPVGTLTINDPQNVLALLVFVGVSAAVAVVVDVSARRSKEAARARAEATTLLDLTRGAASSEDTVQDLLEQALGRLQGPRRGSLRPHPTTAAPAGGWALAGDRRGNSRSDSESQDARSTKLPNRSTQPPGWYFSAGPCRPATGGCSVPSACTSPPSSNASNLPPAAAKSSVWPKATRCARPSSVPSPTTSAHRWPASNWPSEGLIQKDVHYTPGTGTGTAADH